MSIVLLFAPIFIFLALIAIIKCYMTEKRKFTFRDKIIFTMGGFFVLLLVGALKNEIYFTVVAFPFLFHAIILILPMYTSIWRDYFNMINR